MTCPVKAAVLKPRTRCRGGRVSLVLAVVTVATAAEVGLLGAADEDHIAYALSERRVIVTHDDDFLTLANSGIEPAGICYCHQQKRSIGEVLRTLLVVRECCSQDDMRGHVEFL